MKTLPLSSVLCALSITSASAQDMIHSQAPQLPTIIGPEANFTGAVIVSELFGLNDGSDTTAGKVTFQPNARSNWHSHPAGQYLVVADGTGWVQQKGAEKILMRAGDVIWTPPGVMHWHGATDTTYVTHFAIQDIVDGSGVVWGDRVTDADYLSE
ncbi:hypothetical protein BFP70_04180 [Thioclava sp. SK-1]|uniref:(R)-mandelonitrile lyase n=1 Tax=Thioclava sp. SK-1 TaxID=1889770 RepID=UPI0008271B39|nr:cupin domain-containing protein [Thioclava sp. SK-1]OCX66877.1 hypothetical protein BFP70_04180 [Thioclava sp. SK-1]